MATGSFPFLRKPLIFSIRYGRFPRSSIEYVRLSRKEMLHYANLLGYTQVCSTGMEGIRMEKTGIPALMIAIAFKTISKGSRSQNNACRDKRFHTEIPFLPCCHAFNQKCCLGIPRIAERNAFPLVNKLSSRRKVTQNSLLFWEKKHVFQHTDKISFCLKNVPQALHTKRKVLPGLRSNT